MDEPATCCQSGDLPSNRTPESRCWPSTRVRKSLYQSLVLREVRSCKVLEYPYAGEWTSDGDNSSSGVLTMESDGIPAPPLGLSFTKKRDQWLAVADEEGYVKIFNTNRLLPAMINSQGRTGSVRSSQWLAHSNAIFDACWIKEDTHMLTASGDQTIKLWDVESQTGVSVMKGHTGSVKSLCSHPSEYDLFVSGSRDGCVAFWDARTRAAAQSMADEVSCGPVAKIKDAHKGFTAKFRRRQDYTRSVTAVLYLTDERIVATAGANDGVVKYWDSRKLKAPVAQSQPEGVEASKSGNRLHGIASLSQDPSGTRLIASCVDSKIYMYDIMRPERGVLKIFSGHVMGTFYIKAAFSPDGSRILSGSSDHNAYIWEVDEPSNNPLVLRGHSQEVTAVTWCSTDFCRIATCSDDYTVRVWSMKEPRFAQRPTLISLQPVAVEPEAPMSPCAHEPAGDEQETGGKSELNSSKKSAETENAENFDFENSRIDKEGTGTPPAKRTRALSWVGEGLQEDLKDEDSPLAKSVRSPSSVLSPPGSISKRRKTIVDYFGLQPQNLQILDLGLQPQLS